MQKFKNMFQEVEKELSEVTSAYDKDKALHKN
jgi:hypothetical protein